MNLAPRHPAPARPHAAAAGGFTLIEVLVVVSIIVLLLGVVGGGWLVARDRAQTRVVRVALSQLAGTSTEYGVQTRQIVLYGSGYSNNNDSDYASIEAFITAVKDNARPAYDLLQTVNESLRIDMDNDGEPERLNDTWGRAIRYYPGTETYPPSASFDPPALGLPLRKQPYFASAGPDGQWGSIDNDNVRDEQAADNLYSFEID